MLLAGVEIEALKPKMVLIVPVALDGVMVKFAVGAAGVVPPPPPPPVSFTTITVDPDPLLPSESVAIAVTV